MSRWFHGRGRLTLSSLPTQNSGRDGKWDLAVFAERAKEKDKEVSDRAKEAEAAMLKGKHHHTCRVCGTGRVAVAKERPS